MVNKTEKRTSESVN